MLPASLQHRLSARPARSPAIPSRTFIGGPGGAITYEWVDTVDEDGKPVSYLEETHDIRSPSVKAGTSGPPLHIHLRQDETFRVLSGKLGVMINEREHILTAQDGTLTVPHGTRHRFFSHPSATEDLKIRVMLNNEDLEKRLDENFLRNFVAYLADCEKNKIEPSLFQILLFLYDADMVLSPPFYVPIPILKGLHHFMAYWAGEKLLGYKASYSEYSSGTSKTK